MSKRQVLNAQVDYDDLQNQRWHEDVSDQDFDHLVRSMHVLESAKDGIPAIPLHGKTDFSVVEEFYSYAKSKGHEYPEWKLEYELSRESKFGDQGGRADWQTIKPECEQYVLNPASCKEKRISPSILKKYKTLNCRKQSIDDVLKQQKAEDKIQSTAASWRKFDLKKDDPEAQKDAKYCATHGLYKKGYGYFSTYVRKQKNRIFVPGPFSVNLLQAQYHDPLLRAIQNDLKLNGANSPWTFMSDKIGFIQMFRIMSDKLAKQGKKIDPTHIVYVMRDFYHMDTTQGEDQKSKHYTPKVAAAFGIPQNSQEYEKLNDILCFSNRMPIATPSGVITNKYKGEASGVTVTNQGETFCNEDFDESFTSYVLSECKKAGISAWRIDTYGNGDDGFSRWYLEDTTRFTEFNAIIEKAADWACDIYGYIKNDKWKVNLGTYGLYNQFEIYIDKDGEHYDYPPSLAINAIMHPMHEVPKTKWDNDYIDWRTAEILAHCSRNSDFHLLIDYVDSGMKYGLFGKTKEDFIRIFSKYEKYRALQDIESQFNIDDPQWREDPKYNPVIMYLAEKRGVLKEIEHLAVK